MTSDSKHLEQWLRDQAHLAQPFLRNATLVGAVGAGLIIAQAWVVAHILNQVVFHEADLIRVQAWLWALLPLFGLRFLVTWQSEVMAIRGASRAKRALRSDLYNRMRRAGPALVGQRHSGEQVKALVEAVEGMHDYFAAYLPAVRMVMIVPLAIGVAVLPHDWLSALVLLITLPILPMFMALIGRQAQGRSQAQWRELARMGGHFLDLIQGLKTLKLFNASERAGDSVARSADEFRRRTMAVLRIAFLSSAVMEFFAAVSIALLAVFIGFRLLAGEMDFLPGLFVLLLAPEFYLPLRNLGTRNHARMDAVGAAEQLLTIPDMPVAGEPERRPRPQPALAPRIRIEQLGYSYPERGPALQGISLELAPGSRTALVGASGSGKTTLARLLLGLLQPASGRILVDDTDLGGADQQAWRQQVAWVPQHPHLFRGTVADNIRLGVPDAGIEHVVQAARLAHAHDFIQTLPDRYETRIGDGGRGLSGGQIQRIALARAFARDARLVILDEPSAHLDADSERLIEQAVRGLAHGRTMLVIAHRLHTVRDADRICVLDQGRLVQVGDHAELMADTAGHYRNLQSELLPG